MRDIRFRGKDINGQWWYGSLAYFDNHKESFIIPEVPADADPKSQYGLVTVNPDTIGQCTCAFDRYKKRIYEGDIIKLGDELFEVTWDWYRNRFALSNSLPWFEPLVTVGNSIIVGNIHDNPEMLKGGNK